MKGSTLTRLISGTVIAALALASFFAGALPANAATDAVIEGTVVDAKGEPIDYISVDAFRSGSIELDHPGLTGESRATTFLDGRFSLPVDSGLDYVISFRDGYEYQDYGRPRAIGTFKTEWYDNKADPRGAVPIEIDAGEILQLGQIVLDEANLGSFASAPPPTIAGTPRQGSTLLAVPGQWTPTPDSFHYQWFRDGTPDHSSSDAIFSLRPEHAGSSYSVQITAVKAGYHLGTATSAPVLVPMEDFTSAPPPEIAGRAKVGEVLSVNTGEWAPEAHLLRIEWYRSGVHIRDALGMKTYTLTGRDTGHTITAAVTAYRAGYNALTRVSKATAAVAPGPPDAGLPHIVGSPRVNHVLSISPGTNTRFDLWGYGMGPLRFQWYRSGTLITGAAGDRYKVQPADIGHRLTAKLTATNVGYPPATFTTASTQPALEGTLKSGVVSIGGGTKKVGDKLTARKGTWTSGTKFKYQWYRSGKAIKGATAQTYKLAAADAGKTIKVRVTGSAQGYSTASKYSPSTKAVAKGALALKTPVVTGTKKVGYTLKANPGTWTSGTAFKYQWYKSGKAIKGATAKTYKLTKSDRSRSIKVRVTGSKAGYSSAARYSSSHRIR